MSYKGSVHTVKGERHSLYYDEIVRAYAPAPQGTHNSKYERSKPVD
jgi:hypothetical protein